ncbi:MAG: 6-phosphogluconolactonase [Terricaulis silvestris]
MTPALTQFETRDALMQAAAARLRDALARGLAARGQAGVALSGGSTPEPAYAALARAELDWTNVTFALVDERFAPPSDPASNEGMLRRALGPALANGAKLLPMWSDAATLDEAAARADALYAPLHYDLALMGMGADAHTASWFPDAARLPEALKPAAPAHVISISSAAAAGRSERLTLTYAALAKADALLLMITGAEKLARLEAAAGEPVTEAPVKALFDLPLEVFWAP